MYRCILLVILENKMFYDVFVMEVLSSTHVNIKTFVWLFVKVLGIYVG
jgi:hypothetical protein